MIVDALGPDLVAAGAVVTDARGRGLTWSIPTALATWANAITVRPAAAVAADVLGDPRPPRGQLGRLRRCGSCCASATPSTAGSPGATARRRSGAFLDPLADKVLVLGAMFTLVANDVFWIVPVVIIAAREFVVSVYRSVVGTRGVSVPASRMAKYKTLAQQLAVGFAHRCRSPRSTRSGCGTASCGSPSCWRWCQRLRLPAWGPGPAAGGARPHRVLTAADVRRSAPCAVTSSPSGPSCCSARSTTRTRRGSASGWP